MPAPLRDLTLVRAVRSPVLTRATDEESASDSIATMEVRFAPFDVWYRIESWWEGTFLERVRHGAFAKTIDESLREDGTSTVKVMFNHGTDMTVHQKLLGIPESLSEEEDSPLGVVPLFDTSYNRDLLPGLRAGAYGSSFMFQALNHEWVEEPERSEHNPDGLPERTVTEVRLFEFGPVTWPANPSATSGIRSLTDDWYEHLRSVDSAQVEELRSRVEARRTGKGGTAGSTTEPPAPAAETSPSRAGSTTRTGLTAAQRRAKMFAYLG